MKRIYKKRKNQEIKKQALEQLRQTRLQIEDEHPELLGEMRRLIALSGGAGHESVPVVEPSQSKRVPKIADDSVKIDRDKTLETIMRFVELKPHADGLKQELKKILT